jgi:uncharacterized membrane protein YhhN
LNGNPLLPIVSLAAVLSAGLTIREYYRRPPRRAVIFICKPLATILILAVAGLGGAFRGGGYALAVCAGLLFSLLGDIWEMLDRRHFLKALVCFLVTHICYAAAFLTDPPAAAHLWPLLPLALFGAAVLAGLWPALSARMKGAVGAYMAVIVAMASLAAGRALDSASPAALSAAAGALLFLASDTVLAVNRFRRPFHAAQAVILSCYFAGQLLIALSVGLRAG